MYVSNYIGMGNVGGVELVYLEYLRNSRAHGVFNATFLSDSNVDSSLWYELREFSTATYGWSDADRLGPVRLSGPLRPFRYRRAGAWVSAQCTRDAPLLAWNTFGDRKLLKIKRHARIPLIYYEHGSAWSHVISRDNGGHERLRRGRAFIAHLDGVLCNSRAAERMLRSCWDYTGRSAVVNCPLRKDFLEPIGRKSPLPAGRRLRLGMACRLVAWKGVDLAIASVAELVDRCGIDAELHIAGDGPERMDLESFVTKCGISDRVVFRGLVGDIVGFFDDIDVLLVPSLSESYGMVAIEAAARGCPVVATRVDGLPESVVDDVTGVLVRPEMSLDDRSRLSGIAGGAPPLVLDPDRGEPCSPLAPHPGRIADAVVQVVKRYAEFSNHARQHILAEYGCYNYAHQIRMALRSLLE